MENFLFNIGLIKNADFNGLAIKADVSFPMIAARDIAPVATNYLAISILAAGAFTTSRDLGLYDDGGNSDLGSLSRQSGSEIC